MREPNRVSPLLPASAMQSYVISAPLATHHRRATCAEVKCSGYSNGWRTPIDETSDLGQQQAHYIRQQSGRKFAEWAEAGLTVFEFEAGQQCFREHFAPLDRPAIYLVQGGDWRGNPRRIPTRRHVRPEDWVEDFATHQQALADKQQKG